MHTDYYTRGFMDKVADFNKSAKSEYEMTPAELQRSAAIKADIKKREDAAAYRIPRDPVPKTFGDEVARSGERAWRKAKSLVLGASSAVGAAGVRALQGTYDLAMLGPGLIDKAVFGTALGIDNGRGFTGRMTGNIHRLSDKWVHGIRQMSEDYDYRNRTGGKFNRFMQGPGADAVGSFVGWGGARRGILSKVFGAVSAKDALSEGSQAQQLRAREKMIRGVDRRYRHYIDPTSTAYNQQNAPTEEEYRKYNMPSPLNMPSSWGGPIRIPYQFAHRRNGIPVQFRPYGT